MKKNIQNTGCMHCGSGHLTPVCPGAFLYQMDQCKGKNMVPVLSCVLVTQVMHCCSYAGSLICGWSEFISG